ncbi:MAG TPA: hypothetical protein VLG73_04750, partial [Shinella sp.]|nr:hypothetical protein [Shinella sp.]
DPAVGQNEIGFNCECHARFPLSAPAGRRHFLHPQRERLRPPWPIRFWHDPMRNRHIYFD